MFLLTTICKNQQEGAHMATRTYREGDEQTDRTIMNCSHPHGQSQASLLSWSPPPPPPSTLPSTSPLLTSTRSIYTTHPDTEHLSLGRIFMTAVTASDSPAGGAATTRHTLAYESCGVSRELEHSSRESRPRSCIERGRLKTELQREISV